MEEKNTETTAEEVEEIFAVPVEEENTEAVDLENADIENEEAEMSEDDMRLAVGKAQQELKAKEEELEAQQQQYLRLQADFDNYRKRARQEKEDVSKYATGETLTSLLPVLDNLERALQGGSNSPESKDFVVGVEMVYRQLQETLKNLGLEYIPAVGEKFDPLWHEAIGMVEGDAEKIGLVVEELQKGYRFKDKLLRPSMVRVGQ